MSASPSLIQLNAERPLNSHSRASGTHNHGRHSFKSTRLVPIKWRTDRYLVPEHQVPSFAEYLAGVGKFNGGGGGSELLDYYLNSTGDRVDLFTTAPVFPPGYEKFMRMPIVGTIASVGRSYVRLDHQNEWWNDLIVPVTIDVGRNEGVKLGMDFYLVGSQENETVGITRVGLHYSKGFIKRFSRKKPGVRVNEWDDEAPIKWAPIEVGSRLTSSMDQALSLRERE